MKTGILSNITGFAVTSEFAGFPFDNAVDAEKSWLYWRSEDLALQNITLNFDGNINYVSIYGANFSSITIAGQPKNLEFDSITGTYKGFFDIIDTNTSISLVVPAQSSLGAYYAMSGVCIGETEELDNAVFPVQKRIVRPVKSVKLSAGSIRSILWGHKYRVISFQRNKLEFSSVVIMNEFKKLVGKNIVFILFEDMGFPGKCYLCKRTDKFAFNQNKLNSYDDSLIVEEI